MSEKAKEQKAVSIEQQYEQVKQNTTTEAINKLVNEITAEAEQLISQAQKQATSNFNLSSDFNTDIMQKALKSNGVVRISVNKQNNRLSVSLLNGFVYKLVSIDYNTDLNAVYEQINGDFAKLSAFNQRIQKHLNANKQEILKNL